MVCAYRKTADCDAMVMRSGLPEPEFDDSRKVAEIAVAKAAA